MDTCNILLYPNCFTYSMADEHLECPWCGNDVELKSIARLPRGIIVVARPTITGDVEYA